MRSRQPGAKEERVFSADCNSEKTCAPVDFGSVTCGEPRFLRLITSTGAFADQVNDEMSVAKHLAYKKHLIRSFIAFFIICLGGSDRGESLWHSTDHMTASINLPSLPDGDVTLPGDTL